MTKVLTVTFNQPLVPGFSDLTNWLFVADVGLGPKLFFPPANLVIAGSTVVGTGNPTVGAPPGDKITYLAAPPDIFALVGGLPALTFVDFPLTVLP